ncbi:iduronate sulfatase [Clostridium botulinum]|uniref:iduronate sulfatase n=1 Tax=Clostridium botulinum TaxID=1491 RepID=UPI000A16D6EF|nr:iduronate sulfatase [Clostridium botulinum]UZP02331.1 iduronate sulfatase [Clostridium botulinum]UZP05690.1 iduronate sulfatase [Clostridium botulinum]UZP09070.1 iduronate sulfatase [Clostridium botulinum]HBJ1647753.1 iduronate sulfatase [Clostridium botulinum]
MEQTITNLINSFGFPIVCCIAMGFFIYNMWQRINSTLDKVVETNTQLVLTNQSLISNINLKVDRIEEKIVNISNGIK